MKRLLSILIVLGAVGTLAYGADPLYVSPDVPTTTASGANLLPSHIFRYDAAGPLWTLELALPGFPPPNLDALHKMDRTGDWLFSIETPHTLGGALVAPALPGDVIHYDSGPGVYSICFSAAAVGLGPETNVDAVYMIGGDQGSLFLSFDVHTDIGAFVGPTAVEPADIVRFQPLGPGLCPGWLFAGIFFDASAAGAGVPNSSNVGGADEVRGDTILTFDVPTDLAPPAFTYRREQVARTDMLTYGVFETLIGWPISSEIDGLSCLGNPGRVPVTIVIGKNAGNLDLAWQAGCSSGGADYGIYEGTIGTWYSHDAIDCVDSGGGPLTETIAPAATSNYYLVVPHSLGKEEGDYGLDFDFPSNGSFTRPVGGVRCALSQNTAPCP
jgi:hypothetical protein